MKWLFKNKRRKASPRERGIKGFVDLHSHLLPGIDDGAASMAETTEILDGMAELGYDAVVATPHFDNDALAPSADQQSALIEKIHNVRGGRPPLVLTGAEIPFDERFMEFANSGELPTLGTGAAYLLEFGFQPGSVPRGIEEAFFRFQIKQGTIVIAHPERISDFGRDLERLVLLIRAGCLLQVDLLSFEGKHGQSVRETALELLDKGYIHLLSSDIHKPRELESLGKAIEQIVAWDEKKAMQLLSTNPRQVIEGRADEVRDDA